MAILYRLNKVSNDIIPELEKKEIQIHYPKEEIYFNNDEIGIISFLKLIVNNDDEEAFMIVFN